MPTVAHRAGTRVLVVTSDPTKAELLRSCVRDGSGGSFEAWHVDSPASAAEAVHQARAHVVLLDPGGDHAALSALRASVSDLPIVVLVAPRDFASSVRLLRTDADDVLFEWELEPHLLVWRLRLAIERHESERKLIHAKDLAESANHHKSEFVSQVSHDIRTPMNTVLGMAELLGETHLTKKQLQYVQTLRRAGDHLLGLLDEVLDLARIEAGQMQIESASFRLAEVLETALDIVRVQASRKGLELRLDTAPDVPGAFRGDPLRLRQILVNLLANAVKFTDKGYVRLAVTADGGTASAAVLHFTVEDTGIGIPPDKVDDIFTSFVQGGRSYEQRYGGVGLGLNIARRLTELMGGRIWAESTPRGATFHLNLALPTERGMPRPSFGDLEEEAEMPALAGPRGRPLRLLLVDDSEDSRMLITAYLADANVDLDYASDGVEALQRAPTQRYDLVLMDLQLPTMNGFTATRRLHDLERAIGRPCTPVIALSAHALADTVERAREAGCATHLAKPIRKRTLLATIARVAARATPAAEAEEQPRQVPEDALRLFQKFLQNRRRDLTAIESAITSGDFAAIRTLGHNMQGTCAAYGVPELGGLGTRLEAAAENHDTRELRGLTRELAECIERVAGEYESGRIVAAPRRTRSGTRPSHPEATETGPQGHRRGHGTS